MTTKMSFCIQAATTLDSRDLDLITDRIEQYRKDGVGDRESEMRAVDDALAALAQERTEIEALIGEPATDVSKNDAEMNTSEQPVEKTAESEQVGNEAVASPARERTLPDTIEIDGKQRPTTNSNGQPIAATEEGVKNFWKWFGDSKVVDAEGRPLVVYHGTNAKFDSFSDYKPNFFSRSEYYATAYGDRVVPVYLSVAMPLDTATDSAARAVFNDEFRNDPLGRDAPELSDGQSVPFQWADEFFGFLYEREHTRENIQYDGVVVDEGHITDTYGEAGRTSLVPLNNYQIKSAIGNSGEFDPANPNILASPARERTSPDTIEIDGKQRPTTNSNGQPIAATEAGVRNFWKWFGDSKVVDAEGRPLVVYHGTTRGKIPPVISAENFYLTESFNEARSYAGEPVNPRTGEKVDWRTPIDGSVESFYVRLVNPARLDRHNAYFVRDAYYAKDKVDTWREQGHDGVVMPWEGGDKDAVRNFIAFDPAQIKSAIGNSGEFDGSNPSILASPKRQYTAEQQRVLGVAFSQGDTRSVTQKAKDTYDAVKASRGMRFVMAVADKFAPIKGVDEKAYALARMAAAAGVNGVEAILKYGKLHLTDGVQDVDLQNNKGFVKVLADLKGEQDDFFKWVVGHRAEYLKSVDKENWLSDQEIVALKSLSDGKMNDGRDRKLVYEKALAEMTAINNSVIDIAVESGVITRELALQFKRTPYVPFYRVIDEEAQMPSPGKALTSQEAFKRLKGGYAPLNDDGLASMLQNWTKILDASARNRAALATFDAIENTPGLQDVAERGNSETKGAVKVKRDGKWVYYKVNDPYLLEAITASEYALPGFIKPLATFKQMLTYGVTSVPGFKFVSNPIRDAIQSIGVAPELGTNPFKNYGRGAEVIGWKDALDNLIQSALLQDVQDLTPQNQTYASMLASGGIMKMGSAVEGGRSVHAEKMLRRAVGKGVMLEGETGKKFLAQLQDVWNAYEELGDLAEQSNRIALYERMMSLKDENGNAKYTHAEASFAARDLMDFSLTGNGQVVRFLVATVPFLNARIQGLYKIGRAWGNESEGSRERMVRTLTAVTLATLALWAWFKDDEDYKRREDWDVDTYWWFKVGDTAYRIPKPFEIGLMATMVQRTVELFSDEEMTSERYAKEWRSALMNTLAFNPIPQAFKPLTEVYFNTSMFTGRPIETLGDQKKLKEDRYDENTSELAKTLGGSKLVPLSPKQVDAMLTGYFGTVAAYGNALVDATVGVATDRPERADKPLRKVTGNYVDDLSENRSRYTGVLYQNAKDMGEAYASYKAALEVARDSERAREILADNPQLVSKYKRLMATERKLSEINRMIKMINEDSRMTGEEKRQKINALNDRKAKLAESAVKQLQLR